MVGFDPNGLDGELSVLGRHATRLRIEFRGSHRVVTAEGIAIKDFNPGDFSARDMQPRIPRHGLGVRLGAAQSRSQSTVRTDFVGQIGPRSVNVPIPTAGLRETLTADRHFFQQPTAELETAP